MQRDRQKGRPDQSLIMGKNCIKEVAKQNPERIQVVYTSSKDDQLVHFLEDLGIEISFTHKQRLFDKVQSESHQGFVAKVKPRQHPDLRTFLDTQWDKESSLVLMLDSINDPQNLGAILRASECFGADAVLWSKNRGVSITPVVTKASVGASELLTTIKVSNLADAVRKFQDQGYEVVTAEVGEGAVPIHDFRFPLKTLVIMGSEGKGVQQILSKLADHKVFIPMLGQIDSLNVSQATAVMLSKFRNA